MATKRITLAERRKQAANYLRTWRWMECGGDTARRNRILREAVQRIYRVAEGGK
jgi:hypothetical protein